MERAGARAARPRAGRLGPDILERPPRFDAMLERLAVADGTRTFGETLMDQSLVAGIGNMWLAESLWEARLSPWLRLPTSRATDRVRALESAAALMRAAVDGDREARRRVYRRRTALPALCHADRSWGIGDDNRIAYWCPGCQAGDDPRGRSCPRAARPASYQSMRGSVSRLRGRARRSSAVRLRGARDQDGPSLYEYRPLVRGFVEEQAPTLRRLPDTRDAIDDLRREPAAAIFARAHSGLAETNDDALFRSILLPMLTWTAERCGGFDWRDEAFDSAYADLEHTLFGSAGRTLRSPRSSVCPQAPRPTWAATSGSARPKPARSRSCGLKRTASCRRSSAATSIVCSCSSSTASSHPMSRIRPMRLPSSRTPSPPYASRLPARSRQAPSCSSASTSGPCAWRLSCRSRQPSLGASPHGSTRFGRSSPPTCARGSRWQTTTASSPRRWIAGSSPSSPTSRFAPVSCVKPSRACSGRTATRGPPRCAQLSCSPRRRRSAAICRRASRRLARSRCTRRRSPRARRGARARFACRARRGARRHTARVAAAAAVRLARRVARPSVRSIRHRAGTDMRRASGYGRCMDETDAVLGALQRIERLRERDAARRGPRRVAAARSRGRSVGACRGRREGPAAVQKLREEGGRNAVDRPEMAITWVSRVCFRARMFALRAHRPLPKRR